MAEVAQLVELLIVAQEVVGSSPIFRPISQLVNPSCACRTDFSFRGAEWPEFYMASMERVMAMPCGV